METAGASGNAAGVCPPERYPLIRQVLLSVYNSSIYMENYVLVALCEMGYLTEAKRRMTTRYYNLAMNENSTLWEDFNILGTRNHAWSGAPATLALASSGDVQVAAWPPALGSVTTFARQVGDRKVIHLLNFMDADNLSWRDMQGTMPEPRLIEGLPLRLKASAKVNKVWVASPDWLGGAIQELPFSQANGEVTFTLPSLKYWTMIVVE